MKIYISSPGQFYEGFDSRLRGEGRWLVHMAGILVEQGHSVAIFSNDPVKPYAQNGVVFTSIFNQLAEPDCDILFAMDSFPDLPEVFHKTNISPHLGRFNPRHRVWAGYFPIGEKHESIYDMMPVIHPWKYQNCVPGKATHIPVVTHNTLVPPRFDNTRFHWFSKNAHEEPLYIAGVMQVLFKLVKEHGASGSFVDGSQIGSQKYRKEYPENKEELTKILFKEILASGSESFSNWMPYSHVQRLMSQSKLLVGVHHPVAAPSMAEIAAYGGFSIQFGGQKNCPPYDHVDIPFIPEGSSDEEVQDFILEMWNNEKLFTESVLVCQSAISLHSKEAASVIISNFIEEVVS